MLGLCERVAIYTARIALIDQWNRFMEIYAPPLGVSHVLANDTFTEN